MVCLQSVPNFFDDAVQCFIRSQRIVVRQNNMFCFGLLRQFDHELNGAVTPSYFGRVFCGRILPPPALMDLLVRLISALGQTRTSEHVQSMSALPLKADIPKHSADVR